MSAPERTFVEFEAAARASGFDEVLERRWQAGQVVDTHTHPFDAQAVITQGEMWLTRAGATQHLRAGEGFMVPHGVPHAERYGAEGTTLWVARRHVKPQAA